MRAPTLGLVTSATDALLRAYPGRFAPAAADAWVAERRSLLVRRAVPSADAVLAASSGCALSGVRTHTLDLAADSAHALERLDSGLGATCEQCDATLPFERLDAAPTAVRCTGCVPRSTFDTRWCR